MQISQINFVTVPVADQDRAKDFGRETGTVRGLMFATADVDGTCAELAQAGAAVDEPQDRPWGRQATLRDPDGNGLVLCQRPS